MKKFLNRICKEGFLKDDIPVLVEMFRDKDTRLFIDFLDEVLPKSNLYNNKYFRFASKIIFKNRGAAAVESCRVKYNKKCFTGSIEGDDKFMVKFHHTTSNKNWLRQK